LAVKAKEGDAMLEQAYDTGGASGYGEVDRILHEIVEEPGPRFSCYGIREGEHCLRCEIHYNGCKKAPILLTENQLQECRLSAEGRLHVKEFLRSEIDGLISEESWYDAPASEDFVEPEI
jgi:hypothetical protein